MRCVFIVADADNRQWLTTCPGASLVQLLVLKSDIRVRAFSVDDISREKLRELLLRVRSSAMTHLVLMTSHRLAKLVLDQVNGLMSFQNN